MFTRASATRIKTRISGLPMVKTAIFPAFDILFPDITLHD